MKLKTSKDLSFEKTHEGWDFSGTAKELLANKKGYDCAMSVTKQEAIKQIKEIRNAKIVLTMTQSCGEDIIYLDFVDGTEIKVVSDEAIRLKKLSDYQQGKCDIWIQDFFNITDKDLKNEKNIP